MSLTIIDKKCTIDYLADVIPLQRKLMKSILKGKVVTVEAQARNIEYTMEHVDGWEDAYDYPTILKVLNHLMYRGRGETRIDALQQELKKSMVV